jgi:dihydropteroate synthase
MNTFRLLAALTVSTLLASCSTVPYFGVGAAPSPAVGTTVNWPGKPFTEVRAYFERRLHVLTDAGIDPARIVFDPGYGFGKTLEHNLQLLRHLPDLRIADRPLLVGISRKSMLSLLSGLDNVADRHWPTVALTAWLREQGADIHRVHEVAPNTQSLRMIEAITTSS